MSADPMSQFGLNQNIICRSDVLIAWKMGRQLLLVGKFKSGEKETDCVSSGAQCILLLTHMQICGMKESLFA